MKAKHYQVLVSVQSRLADTFTAPGGTQFYNYHHHALTTHTVEQVGKVVAVGDAVEGISVGDDIVFAWMVTHDEDNHILYGDVDLWAVNASKIPGKTPDVFAVVTDGTIKPVCGFAFVEPDEEVEGFGEYKSTKKSEQWGTVVAADSKDVKAGDRVFFGSQYNDNANLNTVLGRQYYIMESERILMKLEA